MLQAGTHTDRHNFCSWKLVINSLPSAGLNPVHTVYLQEDFTAFPLPAYIDNLVSTLFEKYSLNTRDFAIFYGEYSMAK